MSWINAAIGAGMGIVSGVASNISRRKAEKRQLERERKLRKEDQQRQMDMWQKTGPVGQMEQLKKAGLNPALMYGTSASGQGQTGEVAGGAGAPEGTKYDIGENVMQMKLMKAQEELLKAQTKKSEAEAEKTAGVDTKQAESVQRATEIDTKVKEAIGIEYLERQARIEIQRKNAENAKVIREFDAWMDEAFDKDSMEINTDAYGSYTTSDNDLIRKAKRAGLEETIQQLERLKKDLILKDDEHTLNQIELEIREFRGDLTKLGLNEVSASIITKVMQMVFSRGRK